jgi:reverse gyrase
MSWTYNHLFRYLPEENLLSEERRARLEKIMTSPIEEAATLTEDELNEEFEELPLHE